MDRAFVGDIGAFTLGVAHAALMRFSGALGVLVRPDAIGAMGDRDHEKLLNDFNGDLCGFFRPSMPSATSKAASLARVRFTMSDSDPSGRRTRHICG